MSATLETLGSLKVVELKEELTKRKLATSGKKAVLAARLREALESEASSIEEKVEQPSDATAKKEEEQALQDEKTSDATGKPKAEPEVKVTAVAKGDKSSGITDQHAKMEVDETNEKEISEKEQEVEKAKEVEKKVKADDKQQDKDAKPPADTAKESKKRKAESPAAHGTTEDVPKDATQYLHIVGFVRPLKEKQVKAFLSELGKLSNDEDAFSMNKVKSECYAKFDDLPESAKVFKAVDGLKWPSHGKNLQVKYVDCNAFVVPPVAAVIPNEKPALLLDQLFRKTKAKPHIYYLPLTDEQVAANRKRRRKHA